VGHCLTQNKLQVVNWFDNQRRRKSRLGKTLGAAAVSSKPSPRAAQPGGTMIDLTEGDSQTDDAGEEEEMGGHGMGSAEEGAAALRGVGGGDDPLPAGDAMEMCGELYLCTLKGRGCPAALGMK